MQQQQEQQQQHGYSSGNDDSNNIVAVVVVQCGEHTFEKCRLRCDTCVIAADAYPPLALSFALCVYLHRPHCTAFPLQVPLPRLLACLLSLSACVMHYLHVGSLYFSGPATPSSSHQYPSSYV